MFCNLKEKRKVFDLKLRNKRFKRIPYAISFSAFEKKNF